MATLVELRAQREELDRQIREAEAQAEKERQAKNAVTYIALASAFKAIYLRLKAEYPDALPSCMEDMPSQQLPRETMIARRFDVSETMAHNAVEKGKKAISDL